MTAPVNPGDGAYRITSDGQLTGGQQMDATIIGDTLTCVIGVFHYADPPAAFVKEGDPHSGIEFTSEDRANIIINNVGHSGVVTSLPG